VKKMNNKVPERRSFIICSMKMVCGISY
jgi:hypothetical protein